MNQKIKKLNALLKCIKIAGSQEKLAKEINKVLKKHKIKRLPLRQSNISYYVKTAGEVSADIAGPMAEAVDFKVKAKQLRPDIARWFNE